MSEPAEFSFKELMRAGHVKRWQIVRVAREQTIAEHMWRVWAITDLIGRTLPLPNQIAFFAKKWALWHDTPEVITGDIATPTKEAMRKAVPAGDPMRTIELGLSEMYHSIWQASKDTGADGWPTPYEIVKLADTIEACVFLGLEGMGAHAKTVHEGLIKRVREIFEDYHTRYPLVPWRNINHIVNEAWSKV